MKHPPRKVRASSFASSLILTSALCLSKALGTPALAQDATATRTAKVVPERPARVFIMAAYDEACQTLPAPKLTIEKPPRKGTVSFREGQSTTIQFAASGTCKGAKVQGTGIYYTAGKGMTGTDTFTITAELPTGERTSRTFDLTIADD